MRTYRTIGEVEEDYLRTHPEEIESYLTVLFEEYARDGDTAALLSSLRSVGRVLGVSRLAASAGLSRKGLQKALSEEGNPHFESVTAILHAMGYRLVPQKLEATPRP
jgi:probable addiction module antidote protein